MFQLDYTLLLALTSFFILIFSFMIGVLLTRFLGIGIRTKLLRLPLLISIGFCAFIVASYVISIIHISSYVVWSFTAILAGVFLITLDFDKNRTKKIQKLLKSVFNKSSYIPIFLFVSVWLLLFIDFYEIAWLPISEDSQTHSLYAGLILFYEQIPNSTYPVGDLKLGGIMDYPLGFHTTGAYLTMFFDQYPPLSLLSLSITITALLPVLVFCIIFSKTNSKTLSLIGFLLLFAVPGETWETARTNLFTDQTIDNSGLYHPQPRYIEDGIALDTYSTIFTPLHLGQLPAIMGYFLFFAFIFWAVLVDNKTNPPLSIYLGYGLILLPMLLVYYIFVPILVAFLFLKTSLFILDKLLPKKTGVSQKTKVTLRLTVVIIFFIIIITSSDFIQLQNYEGLKILSLENMWNNFMIYFGGIFQTTYYSAQDYQRAFDLLDGKFEPGLIEPVPLSEFSSYLTPKLFNVLIFLIGFLFSILFLLKGKFVNLMIINLLLLGVIIPSLNFTTFKEMMWYVGPHRAILLLLPLMIIATLLGMHSIWHEKLKLKLQTYQSLKTHFLDTDTLQIHLSFKFIAILLVAYFVGPGAIMILGTTSWLETSDVKPSIDEQKTLFWIAENVNEGELILNSEVSYSSWITSYFPKNLVNDRTFGMYECERSYGLQYADCRNENDFSDLNQILYEPENYKKFENLVQEHNLSYLFISENSFLLGSRNELSLQEKLDAYDKNPNLQLVFRSGYSSLYKILK